VATRPDTLATDHDSGTTCLRHSAQWTRLTDRYSVEAAASPVVGSLFSLLSLAVHDSRLLILHRASVHCGCWRCICCCAASAAALLQLLMRLYAWSASAWSLRVYITLSRELFAANRLLATRPVLFARYAFSDVDILLTLVRNLGSLRCTAN